VICSCVCGLNFLLAFWAFLVTCLNHKIEVLSPICERTRQYYDLCSNKLCCVPKQKSKMIEIKLAVLVLVLATGNIASTAANASRFTAIVEPRKQECFFLPVAHEEHNIAISYKVRFSMSDSFDYSTNTETQKWVHSRLSTPRARTQETTTSTFFYITREDN
jgi:hypothetical protein